MVGGGVLGGMVADLQVCTGHQGHQKSLLGQNPYSKGRGKMAAKRQVPMGYKSSKFVVGKRDSVDL